MTAMEFDMRCACCGRKVPGPNAEISKDVEEYVRQLMRNGKPISASTELKRLAGFTLGEARFWIDHSGELIGRSIQTGQCPYCGKELRTDVAKQCRHCLRDWHDLENLTRLAHDE